jgi:hypothetical protein
MPAALISKVECDGCCATDQTSASTAIRDKLSIRASYVKLIPRLYISFQPTHARLGATSLRCAVMKDIDHVRHEQTCSVN